jgi:hypothetical protein
MTITNTASWGLTVDKENKGWGKKVTVADVDLSRESGYAINGTWVRWGKNVSIKNGEYLVVTVRTGKTGEPKHRLVEFHKKSEMLRIVPEYLINEYTSSETNEVQKVKAQNSRLYAYGLYIVRKAQKTNRSVQLLEELNLLVTRIEVIDKELLTLHKQAQNDVLQEKESSQQELDYTRREMDYRSGFEACEGSCTPQSDERKEAYRNMAFRGMQASRTRDEKPQPWLEDHLQYLPSYLIGRRWNVTLPESRKDEILYKEASNLAKKRNDLELRTTLQALQNSVILI